MIKVWLSEILFNDNTKIAFDQNDIVVLVGPNNAGKSATLKEAAALLQTKNNKGKILQDITIKKNGDEKELISFLDSYSRKHFNGNAFSYQGFGFDVDEQFAKLSWNSNGGLLGLVSVFVNKLTTEGRLSAANPPQSIKITSEAP